MVRNPLARQNPAPFDHLMELLNIRGGTCVVGYGLNAELGMPHFTDIINGVWSVSDSKLNPFASLSNRQAVLNWLNWRKATIRKHISAPAYRALGMLQQDIGLAIATQCPDGLGGLNGISIDFELYGNVFQAKCHACGHENRDFPITDDLHENSVCGLCGGNCFPNVQMFGWNRKEETERKLINKLNESELLLLIGTDKSLSPFANLGLALAARIKIIEIAANELHVSDGDRNFKLSGPDIGANLFRQNAKQWQKKEPFTIPEMLGCIHACLDQRG